MTYNSAKPMIISIIVFATIILLTFIAGNIVNGQTTETTIPPEQIPQKVEEVQQQVQATDNQVDAATITAAGGAVVGGIAVLKQIFNQKLNTKRDKTTDKDTGKMFALISKFYQLKYMYPHMTDKEILDLPISPNPMSKMTLGNAITAEADLWNEGNQNYWGLPAINMGVPTSTTIQAIKSKDNYPTIVGITNDKKEEPPAPASSTASQEGQ